MRLLPSASLSLVLTVVAFTLHQPPAARGTNLADGTPSRRPKPGPSDDLFPDDSNWAGRMSWDADSAGRDPRDWYIKLHVTDQDAEHFNGRIDFGPDGHVPHDMVVSGINKDEQIKFSTKKEKNLQLFFEGDVEGKKLKLTWHGTDASNRPRRGTAKLDYKRGGKGD